MKHWILHAIVSKCLICLIFLSISLSGSAKKLYSYQSGNWNTSTVWTTDSTGTTLVGSSVPANGDIVCVLTGRTVTVTSDVTQSGLIIYITIGSTLDLTDKNFSYAITLNGNGLLRASRVVSGIAVLPAITTGTFFGVEGGTVEYYMQSGDIYIEDGRPSYCNLIINLGSSTQIMTLGSDIIVYGFMRIDRGVFRINDASTSKRTMIVNGDLTVSSNAGIRTGTGNTNTSGYSINPVNLPPGGQFHTIFHELSIGGNFTNNGTVRFTNLTYPNYGEFASNGAVTVRFIGDRHSTVTLNGITDFYNFIVDKGIDQTYILTLNPSNKDYFSLFGSNAVRRNEDPPFSQDNPEVRKALWIKNGTLKMVGHIFIPSLAEGPVGPTGNSDYALGLNGQLWINSPNVEVYVTATNATGYPQAPVGASGVSPPSTAEQAFSIYGRFRLTDGYFSTRHSAGIIFWNTVNSSSVVIVEGGTLNTTVMRSTWTAPGKTSYVQTGGTVIVRGNETEDGEMSSVPIFNIPNPSSTFVMTGGDIIIRDRNNGALPNGTGLFLNCDPGNYEVTGGNITFEVNPVNTPTVDVYSRVNFWNLNIKRLGNTGNAVVNMLYDVVVANKLTIFGNATLSAGTDSKSVFSYGDIIINPGGTYDPRSNTTSFIGYGNYFLWNDGTITSGLYNLEVNKAEGSLILVSNSDSYTVRNNLMITSGTLADGGKTVYVTGNVINNGLHVGAGKIAMSRTNGTQVIYGNGYGSFMNLEINNTNGGVGSAQVSMAADITVTGVLRLNNDRLFNLDKYQLTLTTLASVEGTMSNSRFLLTSGMPSDGGLKRIFSDTTTLVYPVGTGNNYTPVTVHLKKIPDVYGSVIVKPVSGRHPFTTSTTSLNYYWKVEEIDFSGIQPTSVELLFNYGVLGDNISYVPGKYTPAVWTYLNDPSLVTESTNTILFPAEDQFWGDYTAGIPDAFGTVVSFYSRQDGNWTSPTTWSNEGYGGAPASVIPGSGNPVFIGDGGANNHTVTVTAAGAMAGSLSLIDGSVLTLGTTTGHNFGTVIPGSNGLLRISSSSATAVFPAGDFGNFLGQYGGTVEFYTGTVSFYLPVITSAPTSRNITTYFNLTLTPSTGYTITMPNTDLTVFGSMTVSGASSTALARLNAVNTRLLNIRNDLNVNSGILTFQNNIAQNIQVDGSINIATGAQFTVSNSGTGVMNAITIGGNINNNGTLDFSVSSSLRCNATFTGNSDALISGRGTITDFYSITVIKGYSSIPVLNVTSSAFSFSNNTAPLVLVNGTFRLTSALTVNVSASGMDIPPTTCLSANGGTIQLATNASDDADVILAGMLEVKAGTLQIGTSTNNNNNDVEYSGAGYPAIEVRGGTFFVNGQVRRSMINGLGSLVYKQSGSSNVIINGRNCQITRAKLEVINTGSVFNMTGGNLTIVRGGSTTYNDLYIRSESSVVTGGTITFGNADTEATTVSNLTLDSWYPLNNITIDGTNNGKTLSLAVNPLILKGNLLINANSTFRADSLSVFIAGNFTNLNTDANTGINTGGYRPGSLRQVTTFNGSNGNQNITGVTGNLTNFAKLIINNTFTDGSVTCQAGSNLRINDDLSLSTGIFADGGNTITVLGDIDNSSTHTSTGSGAILLDGEAVQVLDGDGLGKFGNLTLNSGYDTRMIADMEITGVLTLQGKLLDIGHKLLVLSNTSTGAVAGSFSVTRCIRTDGLVSDAGVRKHYPAGSHNFTFPLGVPGKYERAVINVTANSAPGTITVIPVNSIHPCITGTGTNVLKFYWQLISTGFSNVTATHQFYYQNADIQGNESVYVGDRYYNGVWDNPAIGTVTASSNRINFTNVAVLDGDFTAGQNTEFLIVPTYYSRNATCTSPLAGNWDNVTSWSTVSHAGPAATTYPTGEPVVIADNHIVSTNGLSRKTSKLTLNGTGLIDLASTVGHDFGYVTGTGTIKLNPSAVGYFVFPAGDYVTFTSPAGGTIELSASSGTAMCPFLTTYNNLLFTGAGTKTMIDVDVILNGSLRNESTSTMVASTLGRILLSGNWISNGNFVHSGGTFVFNGNTTISGTSLPVLNNLVINHDKVLTGPASATFGVQGNWTNNGTFNHNAGTVNFSGNSAIDGLSLTTFNNVSISAGSSLTGRLSDNFVMTGNWINNGDFVYNGGGVIFDGNTLVSGGNQTVFGNVIINENHSLTSPDSGPMGVALDFINNGTFNHNNGTLVFTGDLQVVGGSSTTLFENMTVEPGSNTTLSTPGETLRGILLSNGVLNANENLTLLSDASRTALIDGTGTGEVLGILTMQRYLPSRFGYKYFSSPFQGSEVGQFGDHMDLFAAFPTFYRYDENRQFTGWLNYTDPSGILEPMQGYAVNFGPESDPVTVDVAGQVNNGNQLPLTLFNRNRPYTLGFNLIGNPYPSPIDWDSPTGWIRENVDDALYFFDAGTTDQYTGTYSTYINGVSSNGVADNIIPSMQGFFIHVSGGSYPVSSTLIFTNGVRVNDLNPSFHKQTGDETRTLIRISARYSSGKGHEDPLLIYFDERATGHFDTDCDALKLMNTDPWVPNLFAFDNDTSKLSIAGIPVPSDSITIIPLGLNTKSEGFVIFRVCNLDRIPDGLYAYLCDAKTGVKQNMAIHKEYRIYLPQGEHVGRFSVILSNHDMRIQPVGSAFHVYSHRNRLFVFQDIPVGERGKMEIFNMQGQKILATVIPENGYHEYDVEFPTGVYIVGLSAPSGNLIKKVFINSQWE